jgi:hypothetical protein
VSVAARRHDPNVTQGGDERVSVRASKTADVLPIRPDLGQDPRARTRYHGPHESDKTNKPSKIADFVSPHVEEIRQAPELDWLTQQRPDTIASIASTLIPAKGETSNPFTWTAKVIARLFKLAVHIGAYTACAATATDKRAAASAALFVLTLIAAFAAQQLGA